MRKLLYFVTIATMTVANAAEVSFSDWTRQKFPLKTATQYEASGSTLGISSKGGVSIIYRAVGDASRASWNWSVSSSVPATPLKNKGGDDRNIALYFIFAPEAEASALKSQKITSLLNNKSVKALVYTYGGSENRGAKFQNPYMSGRGLNIVLRSAGTGSFQESVNLQSDFASAFGGGHSLIGVAVSADSDDTGAQIKASISNLNLK